MRHIVALALAGTMGLATMGTALAQSRDFDLAGFERIDIATGLNAVVSFGDTFAVHAASSNQDALDKLEVTVDGDTLHARLEQSFFDFLVNGGLLGQVLGDNGVTIQITLPVLTGANASSGADIDIAGATGRLAIDVSSGSDVRLTGADLETIDINTSSGSGADIDGTCGTAELNASSGSNIAAEGLQCRIADANASSGGDISISVSQSIKANASSGGDIGISGNPADTDFNSSSGGDIRLNN